MNNPAFPALVARGKLSDVGVSWSIEMGLHGMPRQVINALKEGGFNTIGDLLKVEGNIVEKLSILKSVDKQHAEYIGVRVAAFSSLFDVFVFDKSIAEFDKFEFEIFGEGFLVVDIFSIDCHGDSEHLQTKPVDFQDKNTSVKFDVRPLVKDGCGDIVVCFDKECFVNINAVRQPKQVQISECFMIVDDPNPIEHQEETIPVSDRLINKEKPKGLLSAFKNMFKL